MSVDTSFAPATLIDKPFGLWEPTWLTDVVASIRTRTVMDYVSESDIEGFVKLVLEDIVNAVAQLGMRLKVYAQWSNSVAAEKDKRSGIRPDILIFAVVAGNVEVPVGVCEVKKPSQANSDADLDNPHVLAQLHHYMLLFRHRYGLEECFGIVTTYSHWRVCWLPEADALAASTAMVSASPDAPPTMAALLLAPDGLPTFDGGGEDEVATNAEDAAEAEDVDYKAAPIELVLHGARVYRAVDQDIVPMLASVLLKMLVAKRVSPSTPGVPGAFALAAAKDRRSLVPVTLPTKFCQYWGPVTGPKAGRFFLLQAIGSGRDGLVWIGATTGGHCYVLKFRRTPERAVLGDATRTSELADVEAKRWSKLWGLRAYATQLAKRAVVVMPYVAPVTDAQWQQADVQAAVRAAIQTMAAKGFVHGDVERRHVGLYRDGKGALRAVLFDLSDVRPREGLASADAVASMLAKLSL